MDGMLSQEEINALLGNSSGDSSNAAPGSDESNTLEHARV